MSAAKKITVALAGNPNSGKSTLFNALTGGHQHVGNWSGKTVEKKSGKRIHHGYEITFIDLPGTYSLSSYTIEEQIARDFIINEKPDIVVDVIDTPNIERNLYLAIQILELGASMMFVLNMFDEAKKAGMKVNQPLFGELLDSIAVPAVASQERGIDEILDAIVETFECGKTKNIQINYGHELEDAIAALSDEPFDDSFKGKYPKRWVALKLLEKDAGIISMLGDKHQSVAKAQQWRNAIEKMLGTDLELIIANQRYGFIAGICRESIQTADKTSRTTTDRIDTILTNRILGFPIFLFLMWLIFQLTFKLGAYPVKWIGAGLGYLSVLFSQLLPHGFISSMITDGIIGGVGGVVVFLPNILLLFLAIAFLEDTGYMARAAFIMDKIMHLIGLHGKSFVPMFMGFGCNVPAIMATRTLENPRDRLTTMLVIPFMSCGARLPVYVLLAGAFFPRYAGNVIFIVYMIGILMAILMALIFKRFIFKGLSTPFVMELPPYRLPTLKSVILHMWRRVQFYITKAGTIILIASLIVWLATSIQIPTHDNHFNAPQNHDSLTDETSSKRLENSVAGYFGKLIEPIIYPLGFDWKIGIALTGGFVAKEIVVSTLATIYAVEKSDVKSQELREALKDDPTFTPLVAFCLMVFTLLYSPCIATISVIYREAGSLKWAWFTMAYTTIAAWIITFLIFQIGKNTL